MSGHFVTSFAFALLETKGKQPYFSLFKMHVRWIALDLLMAF